ncbi:hypothetical protein LOK49_LG02G03394 [Camellia lanceoleosa]|uniref:Uncharacterized protein n=1 Tax=Camellia lanceoleosa TaxID=1840588 RepID=A0ACC0IX90_9ERIC|nr:hypothetical protein LOK49_LG02G03394 [Camellia lanceoleosa]
MELEVMEAMVDQIQMGLVVIYGGYGGLNSNGINGYGGLQDAFSKFGDVVHVLTDRVSGYSNGFGFVRYATVEDSAEGIKGMDGKFLGGWVIFAEYARPRPQPTQFKNNAGSPPPGNGSPYGRQ